MNKTLKSILYFIILVVALALTYLRSTKDKKTSNSNGEKKTTEELITESIVYTGSTASFTLEIKEDTWVAQSFYEGDMLAVIYNLIKKGNVDVIKITMTDFCKDYYGHTKKRYWHKTLDRSWDLWNQVSLYASANDFASRSQQFYPISRNTDEGEFLCCGRDGSCH